MNKVIINMNKLAVVDYDVNPKPFQFAINIPSLSGLTKQIVQTKPIPRKNFLGEKLYLLNIEGTNYELTENELNGRVATPIIDIETTTQEVRFLDKYLEFTLEDILEAKKQQLVQSNLMKVCNLYEINLHDNIDYNYSNHSCDTGYKLIRLHSKGSVKFKPFELTTSVNKVVFNVEGTAVNVKYSFDDINYQVASSPTITRVSKFKTLYVILENPTTSIADISSYSLLY